MGSKNKILPNTNDVGGLFTKPLKGKVLKIFRDIIMGYKPLSSLKSIPASIQELVGNSG